MGLAALVRGARARGAAVSLALAGLAAATSAKGAQARVRARAAERTALATQEGVVVAAQEGEEMALEAVEAVTGWDWDRVDLPWTKEAQAPQPRRPS